MYRYVEVHGWMALYPVIQIIEANINRNVDLVQSAMNKGLGETAFLDWALARGRALRLRIGPE